MEFPITSGAVKGRGRKASLLLFNFGPKLGLVLYVDYAIITREKLVAFVHILNLNVTRWFLQFLFFTDVYLDVIKRSNLDGSDARTIVSGDLKAMDGLSVDWVADNFYWTDAGLNQISVARLDGSNRCVNVAVTWG